ncbi:MAG: hypothetical protein WCJ30_25655 [Deltaproteobacteria bacterium]
MTPEAGASATPGWRAFSIYLLLASVFVGLALAWTRHAAGGPGAPLDDTCIHLQYARSIAEGHAFRYAAPDEPRSSGATSLLYVLFLAIPSALGLRGFGAVTFAQAIGAAGLALTAIGMHRFGRALHDVRTGHIAGAAALASGGLLWMACSGMETIFAIAGAVWIFALVTEAARGRETPRGTHALAALGACAPFVRPELAALSLLAAVFIVWRSRGARRLLALAPLAAIVAVPLAWLALTGGVRTSGAIVKWLLHRP